jgi:hypothetical protein
MQCPRGCDGARVCVCEPGHSSEGGRREQAFGTAAHNLGSRPHNHQVHPLSYNSTVLT